jgi:hypothetical protein
MEPAEEGALQLLPIRISEDGRVATWNPGLTRSARVVLRVRSEAGARAERTTMNSGRARVREGEAIESVYVVPAQGDIHQPRAEP